MIKEAPPIGVHPLPIKPLTRVCIYLSTSRTSTVQKEIFETTKKKKSLDSQHSDTLSEFTSGLNQLKYITPVNDPLT